MELNELISKIVEFRDARDWRQYHKPNHLATAIAIEAAELQERFLWKSQEEVEATIQDKASRSGIAEELADVLIFSLLLAHELGVDPIEIAADKLRKNELRYPVEKAHGKSSKYTEL